MRGRVSSSSSSKVRVMGSAASWGCGGSGSGWRFDETGARRCTIAAGRQTQNEPGMHVGKGGGITEVVLRIGALERRRPGGRPLRSGSEGGTGSGGRRVTARPREGGQKHASHLGHP